VTKRAGSRRRKAKSNGVGGSGGPLLEKREEGRTPFFFSAHT
jgi:hypothetical protein